MDDYRKQASDYEPNFILKNSDSKQPQAAGARDDSVQAAANAQAGAPDAQAYSEPAFRDPRDAFRKSSQAADESWQADRYTKPQATQHTESQSEPQSEQPRNADKTQWGASDEPATRQSEQPWGADPRSNFRRQATEAYEASDSQASADGEHDPNLMYNDTSGSSGSWSNRHGFRKKRNGSGPKQPSPPIIFTRKTLALFIALCLVVSGLFGAGGAMLTNTLYDGNTGSTKTASATSTGYKLEDATGSNMTVQEITEATKASVVEIKTESVSSDAWMQQYVTEGAGSGVIITNDGYIVTNNHVIDGAGKITVTTIDEKEYEAELIGTDSISDVAVLKIKAKGLTPATYGNSNQLAVGDLAVAIGNPLGELGGTVTAGIISALDRQLVIDGKTMTLMQTDSSINPGNSGGGLFNGDGQLIGIVVAKSSGSDVEGLGFAIPINTAADVAQQIMDKGYVSGQPSTGMTYVESGGQQSGMDQFFSGEQGSSNVYIYSVDGTNAKRAGFKKDDMVSAVDGTEITSFNDLSSIITSHKVGDKLKFSIVRGGQTMEISLTLEEKATEQ